MKIKLSNAGKRFNREWIFRNADIEFNTGNWYAITGPNGSGKSTLLQCIGGMLQLSEGGIEYESNNEPPDSYRDAITIGNKQYAIGNKPLANEQAYQQISFCAPYMDVIEEMTLIEFLQFHNQFKNLIAGITIKKIIEIVGLEAAAKKQIRYYSSGMKQRVKLAQTIFFDTAIILLDEPCSNLDDKGIELYHSLINDYCKDRILIVCSNDKVEYSFCTTIFSMTDFKKAT